MIAVQLNTQEINILGEALDIAVRQGGMAGAYKYLPLHMKIKQAYDASPEGIAEKKLLEAEPAKECACESECDCKK